MLVRNWMSKKVVTIEEKDSMQHAVSLMREHQIRMLPVLRRGKLVGVVSDTDLKRASASDATMLDVHEMLYLISKIKIKDIMTRNVVTVNPTNTLEDAILLMQKMRVGAFPVVDQHNRLKGIISIRDLMRAFVNVLGIEEPGTLLCIVVDNKIGQMKGIVDAITEEKISFGSILVARFWDEGRRAVFPYLLTSNVSRVKRKLEALGFELLNPMEWSLDQLPKSEPKS